MMIKKELFVVFLSNGLIAFLISRFVEYEFFSLFLQLCLLSLGVFTIKLITHKNTQALAYLLIFLILGCYALFIETLSIKTGFPYSKFEYEDLMGLKLLNIVPWSVFFVWPTLVICAISLSGHIFKNERTIFFVSIALLLLLDLVFDPAATRLGFWQWQNSGIYFGVPLTNYFGWILSSLLSVAVVFRLSKNNVLSNKYLSYIFLGNLFLWTLINLMIGIFLPHLLGLLVLAILIIFSFTQKHE